MSWPSPRRGSEGEGGESHSPYGRRVCWWSVAGPRAVACIDGGPAVADPVRQSTSRLGTGRASGRSPRLPRPIVPPSEDDGVGQGRGRHAVAVLLPLVPRDEGLVPRSDFLFLRKIQ